MDLFISGMIVNIKDITLDHIGELKTMDISVVLNGCIQLENADLLISKDEL